MHIAQKKLKKLYKIRGLKLRELLAKSGVSKTAYYSLLNKETILPKSISSIASVLAVNPSVFLEEESLEEKKIRRLTKIADKIMENHPKLDRENVWHTLLLLQESPIERLNRGLLRGQKYNFHV